MAVASLLTVLTRCGGGHATPLRSQATSLTPPPPTSSATSASTTSPTANPVGAGSAGTPVSTGAGTTPTTAATASASGCLASQLMMFVGPALGAAGSRCYTNSFQNISSSTSTLYGYPGLQMLDSQGRPIPTDVVRGTSVTVPFVPENLVTLAPGARPTST